MAFGDRIMNVPQIEIVQLSSLERETYNRLLHHKANIISWQVTRNGPQPNINDRVE